MAIRRVIAGRGVVIIIIERNGASGIIILFNFSERSRKRSKSRE
jgi:hypothetical protein